MGPDRPEFSSILDGAASFLSSLWDERTGGFRFAPGRPPTLMATAYAVLGLECAGALPGLGESRRTASASFLSAHADAGGNFRDPSFRAEEIVSPAHDLSYFEEETTAFCQQALDALDSPPPPARNWGERLKTPADIPVLFESYPWRNPWLDSNRVMFTLGQLAHDAVRHGRAAYYDFIDRALDWLDERQSPQTGLWRGPFAVPLLNSMAATFHFTFFYDFRRRPLRYPERIIDSCLCLQEEHGLFGPKNVGNTCLDYDALDLLAKASAACDHRRRAVARGMERARERLLALRNPDGGFAHCKERIVGHRFGPAGRLLHSLGIADTRKVEAPALDYSVCWTKLSCPSAASNALSAWFRLLALGLAERSIGPAGPGLPLHFRRLPFLGYSDPFAPFASRRLKRSASPPPSPAQKTAHSHSGAPLITVVMPAYNAASFIGDALDSLKCQTVPDWECVVVNDGSADATGTIAARRARGDARIRVIEQENRGLGAARNRALREARGACVHCLDADDMIEPDFYESALAAIEERGVGSGPGRCAYASVARFRGRGEIFLPSPAPGRGRFAFDRIAAGNALPPVCYLFERKILERTGLFDETLKHCQDWDLWIRFARCGVAFVRAPSAWAWYRIAPSSLSTNFLTFLESGIEVLRRSGRPDARLKGCTHLPEVRDQKEIERDARRFWLANVLRAVNVRDRASLEKLFAFARRHLTDLFRGDPEALGLDLAFRFFNNPPDPRTYLPEYWRRNLLYLETLASLWPELPGQAVRSQIAGPLAKSLVRISADRSAGALGKRWGFARREVLSTGPRYLGPGLALAASAGVLLPDWLKRALLSARRGHYQSYHYSPDISDSGHCERSEAIPTP